MSPLTLDVVVPTYNRVGLLQKTIASLFAAPMPKELRITILIVDNNSQDNTKEVVERIAASAPPVPLVYVRETKQGLSNARNGGIAAGKSELVAFIDDDEEIGETWYEAIAREFADPKVDYIGGPCLGNWVTPVPDWLPPGYHSAIGLVVPKPRATFGPDFPGILMGGNAVIRRKVFEQVGTYAPHLGRSGKGLLSDEDADLYRRLQAASIHGMYTPDLAIYHYIDPKRLTRRYHRRWCFWRAVSQGVAGREAKEPVPYAFGIPRHRIGRALRGLMALPRHRISSDTQGQAFADELAVWDLCGYFYGKHLIDISKFYLSKG